MDMILIVKDEDFDIYNDWLIGKAAEKFINNSYTHVQCEGEIIKAEVVDFKDGTQGVSIGEVISEGEN